MSHWMLAATLVCGVTMFTACTTNIDNPGTSLPQHRLYYVRKNKLTPTTEMTAPRTARQVIFCLKSQ